MINYIQFLSDVSVGGDHGAITSWVREKHAKSIKPAEKGSWIILELGATDDTGKFTPSGQIRRIPITNVGYIAEGETPKDKA